MTWCEQLTRRPKAPAWTGPAQVHLKLSAGDEPDGGKPVPTTRRDEKFCPGCERCLPANKANFYSHTVRGKPYLHTKCKDCMRAEQVERDRRRSTGGGRR